MSTSLEKVKELGQKFNEGLKALLEKLKENGGNK